MLESGTLNRRVQVQRAGTAQDDAGQPIPGWQDVATAWANIRHVSGMQSIQADAETSVVKASVRLRYRTDVTAGMRVVFGTTVYKVTAVLPDEVGREYVDLACEVVQ